MDLGRWFVNKILQSAQAMQGRVRRQFRVSGEKDNFEFTVFLEDVERLSTQLNSMTIQYQLKQELGKDKFESLLNLITERITYLPESLKIIEKDNQNNQALLRSETPVKNEKVIEYFELLVTPKIHMKLNRNRNLNNETNSISFVIGFDLLERLINDLSEIIVEVGLKPGK
ncbi:hypothetical protein IIC38_01880 [candidate division KSB1 bacterium]|nr:hypothetical protein [candidate division KSB1 bacterium]